MDDDALLSSTYTARCNGTFVKQVQKSTRTRGPRVPDGSLMAVPRTLMPPSLPREQDHCGVFTSSSGLPQLAKVGVGCPQHPPMNAVLRSTESSTGRMQPPRTIRM
eukprot:532930-Amphidinium_carterae.1